MLRSATSITASTLRRVPSCSYLHRRKHGRSWFRPRWTAVDASCWRMQQQLVIMCMTPRAVHAGDIGIPETAFPLLAASGSTNLTKGHTYFCCMRWKRASTLRSFSGFGGLTPYL